MRKLIVIGGGEFSRVIIDTARAAGWDVVGFVDPSPCDETVRRMKIPHLGNDEVLRHRAGDEQIVLGVGMVGISQIRESIVERIGPARWANVIHPRATVSDMAVIRTGAVILAGATICTGASIGEHAIINVGSTIDHDVSVGDFVHVAPQATLGGGCVVQDRAYIGIGAIVRDHVTVSAGTLVGMGAVVSRTYAPGNVLVGIPAKPRNQNLE